MLRGEKVTISFNSDTDLRNRVADLCQELSVMENVISIKNRTFPFDIGVAIRCLLDIIGRKSFYRFETKHNCLTIDITVSQDKYKTLSKNEQREQLGIDFFSYFEKSLSKNEKRVSKDAITHVIQSVRDWLKENNWIDGNIAIARNLLESGLTLFDVSEQTRLPLNEIEDLFCKLHGITFTEIHRDNEKH